MNDSKILPRRDANAADFKVNKYTRSGKYGKAICCPVGQLGSDSYILEEQSYVDSLLTAGTD